MTRATHFHKTFVMIGRFVSEGNYIQVLAPYLDIAKGAPRPEWLSRSARELISKRAERGLMSLEFRAKKGQSLRELPTGGSH